MAGGKKETNPEKLAQICEQLQVGTKKLFDKNGDMWFFELYHHLGDCAEALRLASVNRKALEALHN